VTVLELEFRIITEQNRLTIYQSHCNCYYLRALPPYPAFPE